MEQCAIKIASAVFACLLLSVGLYQAASAMEIGPLEVSRYEDITAFRFGNIAFWLRTRAVLQDAVTPTIFSILCGVVSGIPSCIITSGPLCCVTAPLFVLFLVILCEAVYFIYFFIRMFVNAFQRRGAFEAYMASPVLSRMSAAELFYWQNQWQAGTPLPKEIADAFNKAVYGV